MGLLEQGLVLTVAGMAIVFVFLAVLMFLIRATASLLSFTTPSVTADNEPTSDEVARIAAAIAAARAYRNRT